MGTRLGLARLMLGTALAVPGSFATTAMAQQADACQELVTLAEQGLPEELADTREDILVVGNAGDAARCERVLGDLQAAMQDGVTEEERQALRLVETNRTVVRLQDEAVIEGRVYIENQPPAVAVEEGQTEVVVSGGQPEVTVREQPADILIRQAPAMVRLEMPQPVITIEQPAPEIIITMPAPGVEVANAQPQVEVRQAEPTVRVTQTTPRVELELQRAEDPDASPGVQVTDRATGELVEPGQQRESDVEVELTRNEPQVTYETAEEAQAQVNVERAEPRVVFEQADPQFELVSGGEPEIRFTRSGEPQITFREATAERTAEGGAEQAAAAPPAQTLEGAEVETAAGATPEAAEQPAGEAQLAQAAPPAQQLEGAQIETAPGATTETAVTEQPVTEETAEQPVAEAEAAPPAQQLEGAQIETAPGATTEAAAGATTREAAAVQDTAAADPLWTGPAIEREGYQMVEANTFDATALEGATIYGLEDEAVGDVGEVIVDQSGSVEGVVIDVGGFLGLGERPVLVSFDQLTILQRSDDADDVRVYVDSTEERLEALPPYEE